MSHRPAALQPVETDLTSMIDVVFLLIVFFLCTLSFRVLDGRLDGRLPKDRGTAASASATMFEALDLAVLRDGSRPAGLAVRVQGTRTMDVDSLPAVVAGFVAATPEPRARVSTGPGVTYGDVVSVLDACLAGGLVELTFAAAAL
jgi:biopolymer transport protein ExbD